MAMEGSVEPGRSDVIQVDTKTQRGGTHASQDQRASRWVDRAMVARQIEVDGGDKPGRVDYVGGEVNPFQNVWPNPYDKSEPVRRRYEEHEHEPKMAEI
ncbi:hypothetical protein N7510_004391 [Penicillium lagena]|uniref:uncharacterized protein n=1 Tax=Penicillium lagena TaxID=94218 RepID=UPI00253F9243|nr:uncharacterized protein N7510_004391 [Penicillium lagena]KAJ5620407.1 hypothetical protein N7510_004391 [Penicillium lagena]